MPSSSRDFLKAARQRLTTADFLLEHKYNSDAFYLGGYAVECSIKAVIMEVTPVDERLSMLAVICVGSKMHRPEVLRQVLRQQGHELPAAFVPKLRRSGWDPSLRYETGRKDTGETKGFLRTAREVCEWAEAQLP